MTSLSTGKERAVGTIAYMSPEQLSVCKLTPASDVYSFGVMAYEMLTGRRPTNPESMFQLLEMQRAGVRVKPMDLRPGLPQAAQDVILRALSFEPEARQQKAREFGDELSWALVEDPERTRPQSSFFVDSQPTPVPSQIRSTPAASVQTVVPTPPVASEVVTKIAPVPSKRPYIIGGVALAALLLLVLTVGGAWYVMANRPGATPPVVGKVDTAAGPEQWFVYWLTVQKMQNGKPVGEPFKSEGQIVYGNNWRFTFNVASAQSGALYLVNEGPGPGGQTVFNVLFPTPRNGSAQLLANQEIQTEPNQFDQYKGVERLWVIWSDQTLPDLDAVFSEAAKTRGVIENPAQVDTLKGYLRLWDTQQRPDVLPIKERKQTIVKGRGKTLVNLVELSHEEY